MADLAVEAIHTAYGLSQVLFGVSLEVRAGECIALIGRKSKLREDAEVRS